MKKKYNFCKFLFPDNLAKFDMDAVSYKNQFFILLALVRKVQHESDLPFLRTELVGAGMSDKQVRHQHVPSLLEGNDSDDDDDDHFNNCLLYTSPSPRDS